MDKRVTGATMINGHSFIQGVITKKQEPDNGPPMSDNGQSHLTIIIETRKLEWIDQSVPIAVPIETIRVLRELLMQGQEMTTLFKHLANLNQVGNHHLSGSKTLVAVKVQ